MMTNDLNRRSLILNIHHDSQGRYTPVTPGLHTCMSDVTWSWQPARKTQQTQQSCSSDPGFDSQSTPKWCESVQL